MQNAHRFELRAQFLRRRFSRIIPIHAYDERRYIPPCSERVDQFMGSRAANGNGMAAFLLDRQRAKRALHDENRFPLIHRLFVEQRLRPRVLGTRFEEPLA